MHLGVSGCGTRAEPCGDGRICVALAGSRVGRGLERAAGFGPRGVLRRARCCRTPRRFKDCGCPRGLRLPGQCGARRVGVNRFDALLPGGAGDGGQHAGAVLRRGGRRGRRRHWRPSLVSSSTLGYTRQAMAWPCGGPSKGRCRCASSAKMGWPTDWRQAQCSATR